VLILTPDGLLVRLAAMEPLGLSILRGLAQAVAGFLVVLVLRGAVTGQAFRALGQAGRWMTALFGLGNLLFVLALAATTVANVLVLLATIPLFAAVLGRLVLGEVLPGRTWLAIAVAFAGVVVVAAGSMGRPTLLGDVTAMIAALCYAWYFVEVRKHPDLDTIPTVCLGGLISAALAVLIALLSGQGLAEVGNVETSQVGWIGLMGVVVAVSFACIVTGPRYIPAAEVGLLMLLEAILGPLWVWLVLAERPPDATLLGGAIIVATLAWHSVPANRR